jgi:hypothetical protein
LKQGAKEGIGGGQEPKANTEHRTPNIEHRMTRLPQGCGAAGEWEMTNQMMIRFLCPLAKAFGVSSCDR